MRQLRLEITVNGSISDEAFSEIIGNIIEHVENENEFWHEADMINEDQAVTATIISGKDSKTVSERLQAKHERLMQSISTSIRTFQQKNDEH